MTSQTVQENEKPLAFDFNTAAEQQIHLNFLRTEQDIEVMQLFEQRIKMVLQ